MCSSPPPLNKSHIANTSFLLKSNPSRCDHHRRRHHHHHVILGFSMIGPNETLAPPRTVAARVDNIFHPRLSGQKGRGCLEA